MNERIRELAEQAGMRHPAMGEISYACFDHEKFAELIYQDIITVVAAQALSNRSALDVFKNLKRIYEGVE